METLFYYLPALESVRDFMELGGKVLVLIALLTLVMWALIFERLFFLKARYPSMVRKALHIWESRPERKSWHAHRVREELVSVVGQALDQNLALVKTCVALCPLMGLLGTVTGMISVFEVMAISGSGNPRSMAAGVSMATVPTMAGMVAALSGLAMSAWLDGKAYRERELLGEHMTMDH
ncbi:MAG: MotA/TolQ/ExbB proton channel family protein [Gammaproteobacteria bacterium]|nr:MotA/TolQ/ExbB proton channel family protein [Gammaproteobacteria bacterium]MDH3768835.1 MotA/TolQ/ExbB proton channel family protein [Gammaproteobacteria bacterium]